MPYNADIPGFMNVKSLQVLERLAQQVPENGIIVEVGAFMGRSSWTFAKSAPPGVEVYCIDSWENYELEGHLEEVMDGYREGLAYDIDDFKNFVKDCPNIIPIKSWSAEVKWPKQKKADLIFIDASHVSPDVDNDIAFWYPKLKKDGILLGHDFNVYRYPDVCRAVIAFSQKVGLPIKFFKGTTFWMIEKQPRPSYEKEIVVSTSFIIEEIIEILKKVYLDKSSE